MSQVQQVEKPEAKSAVKTSEHWISVIARNHRVTGRDKAGNLMVVPFEGFKCELDLTNEKHRYMSEALHNSGREGSLIFEVSGSYTGTMSDAAKLAQLRAMVDGTDEVSKEAGREKLRALFTKAELAKAGIPYFSEDENELIMLAIRLNKKVG